MKIPDNFNGSIFNLKTGLGINDWHLDADGAIHAPIKVTQELLASCVSVPTIDEYKAAIEVMLQKYAKSLDYISWDRLLSHINSPDPTWRKDGEQAWRWKTNIDKCAYVILSEVQAGKRLVPSVEDFIKLLPQVPQ